MAFEYAEAINVGEELEQTERLQVDDAPLAMFADSGLRPGVVETAHWQHDAQTRGPRKEHGRWAIPWPQGALVLN